MNTVAIKKELERPQMNKSNSRGILVLAASPAEAEIIFKYLAETSFAPCPLFHVLTLTETAERLRSQEIGALIYDDAAGGASPSLLVQTLQPFCENVSILLIAEADNEERQNVAAALGGEVILRNDLEPRILERCLTFAAEKRAIKQELDLRRHRLWEEEILLQRIIERNADGILITAANGEIVFVNPTAEFLTGKSAGQISGKLLDSISNSIQVHEDSLSVSIPRSGDIDAIIEIRMAPVLWQGKNSFIAMLRDVTERKKIEHAMLMEKERLDITLRSIGDGVITADRHGKVLLINRVVEEITGWNRENATGKNVREIFAIDSADSLIKQLECSGKKDSRRTGRNIGITVYNSPSGEKILEYSCSPIYNADEALIGHVFTLRDVTVRQRMAEHMIQVRKMESLCTAAGKLAHEYDNILTVLMGNITICKKTARNTPEIMENLEKAEDSAARARGLTHNLHALSRSSKSLQKKASVVSLLKDAVEELLITPLIACQWDIPDNLWPVHFNQDQMYDVFRNIILNAIQSMSMGGVLSFRLQNRILSEKIYYPLKSGSYLEIVIGDTGKGMGNEILKRIFDPFFTTRTDAMGMGLTTAFSIVRQHEGLIDAESEIGKGSLFTVYLPAAVSTTETSSAHMPLARNDAHQGETAP